MDAILLASAQRLLVASCLYLFEVDEAEERDDVDLEGRGIFTGKKTLADMGLDVDHAEGVAGRRFMAVLWDGIDGVADVLGVVQHASARSTDEFLVLCRRRHAWQCDRWVTAGVGEQDGSARWKVSTEGSDGARWIETGVTGLREVGGVF